MSATAKLTIMFNAHVSPDRVASMVSGIAAFGNVYPDPTYRAFAVEAFRPSKLPNLRAQLMAWARLGFLRWVENSN